MTLNVVATAVATPLTGSLVAWFGQRRLIIVCLSGFTLASLACAMATSLEAVLFFELVFGGGFDGSHNAVPHGRPYGLYGEGRVLGNFFGQP